MRWITLAILSGVALLIADRQVGDFRIIAYAAWYGLTGIAVVMKMARNGK